MLNSFVVVALRLTLFSQLILRGLAGTAPTAGGAGRSLYFSARGSHTSDILSWVWSSPPQRDFTIEYWIRFGNPHKYHATLTYAVYDATRSPSYDGGHEIAMMHGWGMTVSDHNNVLLIVVEFLYYYTHVLPVFYTQLAHCLSMRAVVPPYRISC